MMDKTNARVIMVGPGLSLKGGIVSVVEGYLDAGIKDRCRAFEYLGTIEGEIAIRKFLSFAKAFYKFKCRVDDYDIVHLHTSKGGSLKRKTALARVAVSRGKKVIFHEHNGELKRDFESGSQTFKENVRASFALANKVVVLSEEWRDFFAENICPSEKIIVLHNGVATPTEPCSPCAHQDVLFLGRLDTRKSPDVLLRASKDVLASHPETKLLFGGDGSPERYKALAQELGILDRCEFLGWVSGDEKEHMFERAGVYCLPSKHEGMPMGVLEAMAHGVPTIATPVGGVPQIINDGINGFLMPVDDEAVLKEKLTQLLDNSDLRAEIGIAGRLTVEQGFDASSCVNRLIRLYTEVLNES